MPTTPTTPPRDSAGTQAIRRAAGVLRHIAAAGGAGASLADVARGQQLARSTAHRILQCLVDEDLIAQTPADKRYHLGTLLHELGLAQGASAMEIAQWRPVVEAVAQRTGITTYLMRRSGMEAVCVAMADGHSALRFVPVEVGQRRLLGVGAGATALLAALPQAQVEDILHLIARGHRTYPRIDEAGVRDAVNYAREHGVVISQGTVAENGFGMGMVIPDKERPPTLAISIASHASHVTESAISLWRQVLAQEIAHASATVEAG